MNRQPSGSSLLNNDPDQINSSAATKASSGHLSTLSHHPSVKGNGRKVTNEELEQLSEGVSAQLARLKDKCRSPVSEGGFPLTLKNDVANRSYIADM